MVSFGGTIRCAHCIIHGRLFETLLGIILVTLGFILVALGSILVTLGTPGNLRGTLCDQWQDFLGNLRFLGIPPGTHVSTFSAKNSDARGHRPEARAYIILEPEPDARSQWESLEMCGVMMLLCGDIRWYGSLRSL